MKTKDWSLYFHIPFCAHRCSYCDFFTTAGYETEKIKRYFSYLSREFELFARSIDKRTVNVHSIFVGGGTPSYAPAHDITALIAKIHTEFDIAESAEVTVEVNPQSALLETLAAYREAGVNRLSIGVQSLEPGELRILERTHSSDDGFATVEAARAVGFNTISTDFIYGIPGQTVQNWGQTLKGIEIMRPQHVSAYSLILEGGTKMTKLVQNGTLKLPEDDAVAEMYELTCLRLAQLGYLQYEVSNYALPGFISRHNTHYWKRKPYKGFGMSAHSFYNNTRTWNTTNFVRYYKDIEIGRAPVEGTETLSQVQQMNETIMLRLCMCGGLSMEKFAQRFGRHNAAVLGQAIDKLLGEDGVSGYFHYDNGSLRLSTHGFLVSDEIISQLLLHDREIPQKKFSLPPLPLFQHQSQLD